MLTLTSCFGCELLLQFRPQLKDNLKISHLKAENVMDCNSIVYFDTTNIFVGITLKLCYKTVILMSCVFRNFV